MHSQEFIIMQRELVSTLMRIPGMNDYQTRNVLVQGLPQGALVRNQSMPLVDLNGIVNGLNQLGRLDDKGGTRPLIVVVDNALMLGEGFEVGQDLEKIKQELVNYYGGDSQPNIPLKANIEEEALIFGMQRDTRLHMTFLQNARRVGRSVARLRVPRFIDGQKRSGIEHGTAWLIAPGVIITNYHVVEARDKLPPPDGLGEGPARSEDFKIQAKNIEASFDYFAEMGAEYMICNGASLLAQNADLDYAVLELNETQKVADRDPLQIIGRQPELKRGNRLNIVQHPGGGPLQYAIRNNFFVREGDAPTTLRYQTDTQKGASGSPVCDDFWQVVGLHHGSTEVPSELVPQEILDGQPVEVKVLNQATKIHAILDNLPQEVRDRIEV